MQNDDCSTADAAVASLIIGGITYALDSWGKKSSRDEAELAAVRAAGQKIQDCFVETLSRAKQTVLEVSSQKGWARSEAGWDSSEERARSVRKLMDDGNFKALAREADRQAQLRPRDPFIRLARDLYEGYANLGDPAVLAHVSEDSYKAEELIPPDAAYDDYRLDAVSQSAMLAQQARDVEVCDRGGDPAASSAISRFALSLWSLVLGMQPDDPTGWIRMRHAMAALMDGDVRRARREAEDVLPLLKDDSLFQYWYACILSRDSDWEHALRSLASALSAGAVQPNEVRGYPVLKPLWENKPQEFAKLVVPQWSWSVTDDWVWDDVILKNDSLYPLTNIRFVLTLQKGDKSETLDLKCDAIKPGEVHKWTDVVKGVEGVWDKTSKSDLACDQSAE